MWVGQNHKKYSILLLLISKHFFDFSDTIYKIDDFRHSCLGPPFAKLLDNHFYHWNFAIICTVFLWCACLLKLIIQMVMRLFFMFWNLIRTLYIAHFRILVFKTDTSSSLQNTQRCSPLFITAQQQCSSFTVITTIQQYYAALLKPRIFFLFSMHRNKIQQICFILHNQTDLLNTVSEIQVFQININKHCG